MANYQTIIDAIDAAILAGVSGPGEISTPTGGSITYRNLYELRETRKMYVELLGTEAKGGGRRFATRRYQTGSSVGS